MSRRELHGENVKMIEYTGKYNEDVMREFAEDILAGEYSRGIIHSTQSGIQDEETTYLYVMVSEI